MIDITKFRHGLILAQVLILGFVPGPGRAQESRNVPEPKRGFEQVQIEALGSERAALVWGRPVTEGYDLFLAVRDAEGAMQSARRINRSPGDARLLGLDEARPALATDGSEGIGVAWFDRNDALWATRSDDGGKSFADPIRLDGGDGRPENVFVHAAFGSDADLHVVWIDARAAEKGQEEPAHVYHVVWGTRGPQPEEDLTGEHFESVCGCCRPFVRADRFGVTVVFRGIDEGFRDVHRVRREARGAWSAPERIGPPLWEIDACPMAGPIVGERGVLWRDGSTGRDRILFGTTVTATPVEVVRGGSMATRWLSPRWVDADHVLVPGDPEGLLLERTGRVWEVVRSDLPSWCTDMARIGSQWLMVGDVEGRLELEALVFDR